MAEFVAISHGWKQGGGSGGGPTGQPAIFACPGMLDVSVIPPAWAHNSARLECHLHTVEVAGSNPAVPMQRPVDPRGSAGLRRLCAGATREDPRARCPRRPGGLDLVAVPQRVPSISAATATPTLIAARSHGLKVEPRTTAPTRVARSASSVGPYASCSSSFEVNASHTAAAYLGGGTRAKAIRPRK